MAAQPDASVVATSDRVELNVGGERFVTTRVTLTKRTGTMLATMFTIGNALCAKPDADGSYFIDGDGALFRHVLNALRHSATLDPADPPPNVGAREWRDVVDFYGMAPPPTLQEATRDAAWSKVAPEPYALRTCRSGATAAFMVWVTTSEPYAAWRPINTARPRFFLSVLVHGVFDRACDEYRRTSGIEDLLNVPRGCVASILDAMTNAAACPEAERFVAEPFAANGWAITLEILEAKDASDVRWPGTLLQHQHLHGKGCDIAQMGLAPLPGY